MASYTTLVHVDADAALKVASLVSKLLPDNNEAFEEECSVIIKAQKTRALVDKLLEKEDFIIGMERDCDIEAVFQAMFSLIYTLNDDTKDTADIIRSIVNKISANKEAKPRTRLTVLIVLFNIIFSGESKSEVINAILEYALATKQTQLVAHFFNKVDDWSSSWVLSVAASRKLLQNFAAVLEQEGDKSVTTKALVKYFQTYKSDNSSYPAEVEKLITTAVLSAVNSPVDAFADRVALLESFNTQNFSAALKPLVELLQIICDGALPEFLAFKANVTQKAVFAAHKLDVDALEHSMKLLTLCSLAAQATDKVLTFGTIQAALQVDAAEVELWVIEAIGERLLEASIDQLNGTVTVNRYAHRSFGAAHWRTLQQKLRALRKQVATAVDTLNRNKTPSAAVN